MEKLKIIDKLSPCPFCNNKNINFYEKENTLSIVCGNCLVLMQEIYTLSKGFTREETYKDLIKRWERRFGKGE